jgi:hypothetical protein
MAVNETGQLKSEGRRFSLTFNKWISPGNRWYFKTNAHSVGGALWNNGIVCVYGSTPAENYLQLVQNKNRQIWSLSFQSLILWNTDSVSVRIKFG